MKETLQKRICEQEVEHKSRVSIVELKADSVWAALENTASQSREVIILLSIQHL